MDIEIQQAEKRARFFGIGMWKKYRSKLIREKYGGGGWGSYFAEWKEYIKWWSNRAR